MTNPDAKELIDDLLNLYSGDARGIAIQQLVADNERLTKQVFSLTSKATNNKVVMPLMVVILILPLLALMSILVGSSIMPTSILLGLVSILAIKVIASLNKAGE